MTERHAIARLGTRLKNTKKAKTAESCVEMSDEDDNYDDLCSDNLRGDNLCGDNHGDELT